jgi:uncharacterized protein with von Willebrand factor type A (vWA) domain
MPGTLLPLLRAARGAGVRISTAETLDALAAAEAVGFADRRLLRDALTLTLAKSAAEQQVFEAVFDRYFQRDAPGPQAAAGASDGLPDLAQSLLAGDAAGIAIAMEAAAEAVGASGITLFTQTNLFARRMLDRMGLPALEREIVERRAAGDTALADRLDQARAALGAQARGYMERQLALFAAGTSREIREQALRRVRLSAMDRRDLARMRALIREIARRIATRYSRRRWRARRGALDARRTLRRNMSHGGVPFRTVWKRTRIDRPRVMLLCDVSGSVAPVAHFLLMFVYALSDVLAGLRAFAFSSTMVEVSDLLARHDIDRAAEQVMEAAGFGASDYGRALAAFADLAQGAITRDTTLIVLGDARGNRNPARVEVMRAIFARAARVIWLNPEPRALWGTGDSDMLRYLPYCHQASSCNTLDQLERVIDDMLRTRR